MEYPNLKNETILAIDIETKDPNLLKKGPGVYRKDGYILGVSIGTNSGFSEYYPINHIDTKPETKQKNLSYIKEVLNNNAPKLGANLLYDIDWLENFQGIKVNGELHDIQIAEPLINSLQKSFSLDSLAKKYLGVGKVKKELEKHCTLLGLQGDVRKHLWKLPESKVRDYAKGDTSLPIEIFKIQKQILMDSDLWELYKIESGLLRLLLQMRKTGVRIDEQKLQETKIYIEDTLSKEESFFFKTIGKKINYKSPLQLADLFNFYKIEFPKTEKGNPALDQFFLKKNDHPLCGQILSLKKKRSVLEKFIYPYEELIIDGRIHCQFNLLKGDATGTVTGRFSSTNPNLQQVSSKEFSKEEGQIVRKLFIPEEAHKWVKRDYSQVEYRIIAHYALGEGSDLIRNRYNSDPKTDYHTEMGKLTGIGVEGESRKLVKTLNFGAAYGMGFKKMSVTYGWDLSYAKSVYKKYHEKVPFVLETANKVAQVGIKRGFIKTILGRQQKLENKDFAYKLFNYLIQGSAADIMKKAMYDAYNKGIFNTITPHLTVHDELDTSENETKAQKEAGKELVTIMENCVKLKVPLLVGEESGPNWGEVT